MPSGVAGKRHDDPMFVVSSDTSADQLGFISEKINEDFLFPFRLKTRDAHSKMRTWKHGLSVSIRGQWHAVK